MDQTEGSKRIGEWQGALADAFRGPSGLIGERLCVLQHAEQNAQRIAIQNFAGYSIAADSFFDFAIQSLDLLARPVGVYDMIRTPLLVATVSRLRSSYVLFWKGYWYDAASLLRGVFENVVHLCASAQGWFDLASRFDCDGIDLTQSELQIVKGRQKLRVKRNAEVDRRIYGLDSGLAPADQEQMTLFFKQMHGHVHETETHMIHLVTDVRRNRLPASVFPQWNNHRATLYTHGSLFLSLALTRLIAYAVPAHQRSDDWTARRDILDRSIPLYFDDWPKPLSGAFMRFINEKFAFSGEWPAPLAQAVS